MLQNDRQKVTFRTMKDNLWFFMPQPFAKKCAEDDFFKTILFNFQLKIVSLHYERKQTGI